MAGSPAPGARTVIHVVVDVGLEHVQSAVDQAYRPVWVTAGAPPCDQAAAGTQALQVLGLGLSPHHEFEVISKCGEAEQAGAALACALAGQVAGDPFGLEQPAAAAGQHEQHSGPHGGANCFQALGAKGY